MGNHVAFSQRGGTRHGNGDFVRTIEMLGISAKIEKQVFWDAG